MVQVNWTLQAKDDLRNIADYISKDFVKYAELLVRRIRNRTGILKSQIRIGRIIPAIENRNIRELIEGNYRII